MDCDIRLGDCIEVLKTIPDKTVQCVITSPPYFQLRNYGAEGQIGLEETPELFIEKLVEVFDEVRRVMKNDATLWVNMGDSYFGSGQGFGGAEGGNKNHKGSQERKKPNWKFESKLKPKDLIGMPWKLAFALRDECGFYLRSDIVWHKTNPMPGSQKDRPTTAHEYLFMFSKSARYYYNHEAIREKAVDCGGGEFSKLLGGAYSPPGQKAHSNARNGKSFDNSHETKYTDCSMGGGGTGFKGHSGNKKADGTLFSPDGMREKRDVWSIPTAAFKSLNGEIKHFATYPPDLIKPCILAGSRAGDIILDPFCGSGTTGMVAMELGRKALLIELNPEYVELIKQRTNVTMGLAL